MYGYGLKTRLNSVYSIYDNNVCYNYTEMFSLDKNEGETQLNG